VIAWLVRRLAAGVAILWAVVTLTFFAIHLAPGDPFLPAAERPQDPAVVAGLRRQFGLDRPLAVQYVRYLGQVARGNLGVSFAQRRPVADVIVAAVPHTLLLAATALAIDFLLGILLGVVQASRAGRASDVTLTMATLFVGSMPVFWVGLMLLLVFGEQLHWLPLGGAYDAALYDALSLGGRVVDRLRHLALPALTLGLVGAGWTARFQRAAVLEALGQDWVRTARAKGATEARVLRRHALRPALLSTVTLFGLSFPFLLTGAVLVETVFAWPGMGRLAADAVAARDYPLVTATAIVASAMVVLGSLIADVLAAWVDPRARHEA
jgi:peptide/nickel transport system permease protein